MIEPATPPLPAAAVAEERPTDQTAAGPAARPTAVLSDRWTIVGGLPLFARVCAEAAPPGAMPIVHVHGFGISGRSLEPTAVRLAPHYPTYVPDLPGHGRSHKPRHTPTIPELADALAAFMDAVGVPRAVLLGNSMGCLVVIDFALRHPARIERAILVSPAGGPHNQPLLRGLPQLALDGLREPPRLLPVAVPDYLRFGVRNSLRLFRAMTRYPTLEQIVRLTLPVLVVVGTRDPLVSKERARAALEWPLHLTLVFLRRSAHAVNFSHPDALASAVRAYLEDRPIGGGGASPGEVVVVGRSAWADAAR